MNWDYLTATNIMKDFLTENGFSQRIDKATHEEGGLLDQVYVRIKESSQITVNVAQRTKYYSARIDVNSTVCKGKDRKNVITSQTKPGKQLMNGKVQNGTTSEERIFNPNLHLSKAFAQQVLKGKRLKMKD